jgi:hypothetical protein
MQVKKHFSKAKTTKKQKINKIHLKIKIKMPKINMIIAIKGIRVQI